MSAAAQLRLVVLGVFTAVGLVETTKAYVSVQLRDIPLTWWDVLVQNLPWWYLWATLTPVIVWASARMPFSRRRWVAPAALHAALWLALSTAHLTVFGVYYWHVAGWRFVPTAGEQVRRFLDNYLIMDLVTYGAILAAYHVFDLYRNVRAREIAVARAEAGLTEARLVALRRELNPHFLFNTLNTVAGFVRRGERAPAIDAVARLGDLLRISLDRNMPHRIHLSRELELLALYVDIERARFHDRLTVVYEIAAGLGDAPVPALVLQPLVENAVRHAVCRTRGPARIDIRAFPANGELVLEVADTGPGFPPVVLAGHRHGVGLTNTRERLDALYGPAAGIVLENSPGGGARVAIRLPYAPVPTAITGRPDTTASTRVP